MNDKKSILITGVPGSGKSTLCKYLKKKGYETHDLDENEDIFSMLYSKTGKIAKDYKRHDLDKVKLVTWTCDPKKLEKLISKQKNNLAFYCSAGFKSNVEETIHMFDDVILLQPTSGEMQRRLSSRPSKKFGGSTSVRGYILKNRKSWENKIKSYKPIVINADMGIEEVSTSILNKIRN